jgi:hypothetical protein
MRGLSEKDCQDVKLSRPVAVVDLWDIDDRIDRLEGITERLEIVAEVLFILYKEERVKNWTLILEEMLKKQDQKKGNYGNRVGRFKNDV